MSAEAPKNVLVVGKGGRENALGWKLSQSPNIGQLYFTPGNEGTSRLGINPYYGDIGETDVEGITRLVADHNIDLTVIGPESSLEAGLSDALQDEGHTVFGPSKDAAQLETSKAFAVDFMQTHDIPHPETWVFTDPEEAIAHVERADYPIVVKASGLAGGKGVFLPDSLDTAAESIHAISRGEVSKTKGDKILIQRRLQGREVSMMAISDGHTVIPLLPAQDYKRAYDGNKGPNTGGMGAFAPSPVDSETMARIQDEILQPTIDGMAANNTPYKGVLYAGLMLTADGPKVIEYNARFGDPETQPLMMLLDSDLLAIMEAVQNENLSPDHLKFKKGSAVCVVLADKGYPGEPHHDPRFGRGIDGLRTVSKRRNVRVFRAGVERSGPHAIVVGGRVLGVTAYGNTLEQAVDRAYKSIGRDGVSFQGMEYRSDIGEDGIEIR